MKIVMAPDSFKESMTARTAAEAMERGWKAVFPESEVVLVPMADGGEGTVQSMVDATGGHFVDVEVEGPLGHPVSARYGLLGDGTTAVIEMAAASGIGLVTPEERDPKITSTYGTGQLIAHALDAGVETILIGIGGSATNDGGAGMAEALGVRLLDEHGEPIARGGAGLRQLARIEAKGLHPRVNHVRVIAACDVNNPLTGPQGASAVFGPQKGASPADVALLDDALSHYAERLRTMLGAEVEHVPGAGAAGGLGAGLMAFLNADLQPGVEIVVEHTALAEKLQGADLVLTGEGGIDGQTRFGKTPYGVAKTAQPLGIPVIAVAGTVKPDSRVLYECGFDAIFPIVPGACGLAEALADGEKNLEAVTESIARVWRLAYGTGKE